MSVAIAALNEGPDLEVTVAMVLGGRTPVDRVAIVDDCSLEPVAPRFAGWNKVTVVRNRKRTGSGPSKHRAAEMVKDSDYVVVMDSHMRVGYDWLNLLLEEHRENPCAVLCCANRGFEYDGKFHGAGAKFVLESEGFWKPSWLSPRPVSHAYTVPCVIGGLYSFPRNILEDVGGYAPGLVGYGCEEEWASLRVWARGHECRVSTRCIALHHYGHLCDRRSADGAAERPWEMARNRIYIRNRMFPGKRYRVPFHADHAAKIAESVGTTQPFGFVRSEDELCRMVGIEHPKGD